PEFAVVYCGPLRTRPVTTSYLAPVSPPAKRPAILGGHPAFSGPVYFTRPPVPDPGRLGALTTQVFESRWFTNDGILVRQLEERVARQRGLRVIYDAAQAFGATSGGRGIGHCGDLSVFSFHATKVFHTAEGGAVVGHDPALLERVGSLRNFAIRNEEETCGLGIN